MNKYRTYQDYLDSAEWKQRRIRILIRDEFQCRICGTGKQLRIHHIRYPEEWGMESDEDLITVCDSCHQRIHAQDLKEKELRELEWEDRRRKAEERRRDQWLNSSEYKWAHETKYRDFIYGGSENMCSLTLLKNSAADYEAQHGGRRPAVMRLQYVLGVAHNMLVIELFKRGYTTDQIYLMTPLDRSTVEKYLQKDPKKRYINKEILDYTELQAVVNLFVQDLESKGAKS